MRAASSAAAVLAALLAAAPPRGAAAQQCAAAPANTAYTGLDISYALVASAGACCSQCASTPMCAAYTWVPDPATGGRCFLKTAAASPTALPGAVSGTLTGGAPSSCAFGLVPCTSGASKGACALFADWCATASCAPGVPICPDGRTCSASTTGWDGCPPSAVPAYLNVSLPVPARLAALLPQLSVAEIAPQLSNAGYGAGPPGPPGIERLAVPPYNWLNEGLHGFARAGLATSFPQISVVGQTFNRTVFAAMGRVLGIEARAKYAMDRRTNSTAGDYDGLTLYAPNINNGRDPRWGRLQEVVSEDPYLTSEYGVAAVRAAQAPLEDRPGADTTPKIYACCKHAVAYSFEDYNGIQRSAQNAIVSGRDLLETYLPAFQACIRDAGGKSVMASYNAVNGVPTVASAFLLNTTIRGRYGFGGSSWVVSDYSAVMDTWSAHKYCAGPDANDTCTSLTLRVGTDQDGGGNDFTQVPRLIQKGLLTEAEVRTAAGRLFQARLELGLLNPPEAAPYTGMTPMEWLDTDAHRAMSYEAAQQGMVLLKNDALAGSATGAAPVLPLDASKLAGATVAVIGPNADDPGVLVGNYNGTAPFLITPRAGLAAALAPLGGSVVYAPGCSSGVSCTTSDGFAAALAAAAQASVVVGVFGINQSVEAEGHDRASLDLPGLQLQLIGALADAAAARGVPFVLCLVNGGPLDVTVPQASPSVPAILLVGYASQSTGTALADILLGRYAPAGKLAVTWWRNATTDLPDFADMGMQPGPASPGRTYRYNTVPPLYPFGFGLSYTDWSYGGLTVTPPATACGNTTVTLSLANTGSVDSSHVVQVYVQLVDDDAYPAPRLALAEFDRVWVPAKAGTQLSFTLPPARLARVNASAAKTFGQDFATHSEEVLSGKAFGLTRDLHAEAARVGAGPIGWDDLWAVLPGTVTLWVGSGQPDTGAPGVRGTFAVPGTGPVNLAQCAVDAAAAAAARA